MGTKNPAQLETAIRQRHRFRYEVAASGGTTPSITNIDLLDLVAVASGPTAAYRILDGIRIEEVEMWCANNAALGLYANQITLEWSKTNLAGGAGFVMTDSALGATDIAHICSKPPRGSQASFWVGGNAIDNVGAENEPTVLFEMRCPQYTIVDIVVSLVLSDVDGAVLVTGPVVGATLGQLYYRYLDSTSNKLLIPVGANYI